jgi:hypothetical protein
MVSGLFMVLSILGYKVFVPFAMILLRGYCVSNAFLIGHHMTVGESWANRIPCRQGEKRCQV